MRFICQSLISAFFVLFLLLFIGATHVVPENTGRFQIVFGNIREASMSYTTAGDLVSPLLEETIPVCFKLDTITGQVFEFNAAFVTIRGSNQTQQPRGFKPLPDFYPGISLPSENPPDKK